MIVFRREGKQEDKDVTLLPTHVKREPWVPPLPLQCQQEACLGVGDLRGFDVPCPAPREMLDDVSGLKGSVCVRMKTTSPLPLSERLLKAKCTASSCETYRRRVVLAWSS